MNPTQQPQHIHQKHWHCCCACSKIMKSGWQVPLQLLVAVSVTYCYLNNESFDFFKVLINNGG